MMKRKRKKIDRLIFTVIIFVFFIRCTYNSTTEKHYNYRDHIVNVHDRVKEIYIPEEDILIGSVTRLYSSDKYLIIVDHKSDMEQVLLFDKQTYKYLTSTAFRGQGPGEIANIGHIGIDEKNRKIYVSDHGKQKIFGYDLDSIFQNPDYMPFVKLNMNKTQFPDSYQYINDTLCYARIIVPTGDYSFNEFAAKWNMQTGEMKPMNYSHPKVEKRRITLDVSIEDNLYAEAFHNRDLITVLDLDGNLKFNIYGNNWRSREENELQHYGNVILCKNRIIASYSGGDRLTDEYFPTKLIVFDREGNHLKTLETNYRISDMCYDKDHNRIIMSLDDEIQFAYLDLDGLLD